WLDDVRLRSQGGAFITQQPDIRALPAGTFNFTVPSANATAGWTVSGLPAGMSLNAASGTVSGMPQRRGIWPMQFFVNGPSGHRLVSWRWTPDAAGDPATESAVVDQVSFTR